MTQTERNSILFVCQGNTCRSPMAEAIFSHLVQSRRVASEWTVDSAGLVDWHEGMTANYWTLRILKNNGIESTHISRKITDQDFNQFKWIMGMDQYNIKQLQKLAPKHFNGRIELLGKYYDDPKGTGEGDKEPTVIWDPYGDRTGQEFLECYHQCVRSCTNFLDSLYLVSGQPSLTPDVSEWKLEN